MTAKYETLGDIANELQVMKDQGMTKSSVLYAMSNVFFEENALNQETERGA